MAVARYKIRTYDAHDKGSIVLMLIALSGLFYGLEHDLKRPRYKATWIKSDLMALAGIRLSDLQLVSFVPNSPSDLVPYIGR